MEYGTSPCNVNRFRWFNLSGIPRSVSTIHWSLGPLWFDVPSSRLVALRRPITLAVRAANVKQTSFSVSNKNCNQFSSFFNAVQNLVSKAICDAHCLSFGLSSSLSALPGRKYKNTEIYNNWSHRTQQYKIKIEFFLLSESRVTRIFRILLIFFSYSIFAGCTAFSYRSSVGNENCTEFFSVCREFLGK